MAGEYRMDTLKRGEARRQAILDWLHQHPGADMDDIKSALSEHPPAQVSGSVAVMCRGGEIRSSGEIKHRRFVALARVTRSAEAMLLQKRANSRAAYCKRSGKAADEVRGRGSSEAKAARLAGKTAKEAERKDKAKRKAQSKPGHLVYFSGDNPEIRRNQRGQGALRARVTINCQQNY